MRWLLAQGGLLLQFTRLTFARLSQIHLFARKTSARSSAATWSHGAPSLHLSQARFQVLKGGETVALAPRSFDFTLYSYPSRRATVVLHNCLFMPACLQSIFICAHCRRRTDLCHTSTDPHSSRGPIGRDGRRGCNQICFGQVSHLGCKNGLSFLKDRNIIALGPVNSTGLRQTLLCRVNFKYCFSASYREMSPSCGYFVS